MACRTFVKRFFSQDKRVLTLESFRNELPMTFDIGRLPKFLPNVKVTANSLVEKKEIVSVEDSALKIVLPFASDKDFFATYRQFFTTRPRLGKIMEDMDAFAADVAIRHYRAGNGHVDDFKNRKLIIVTAAVDKIRFEQRITTKNDLILEGCVTYVGKTSMEVKINISVVSPDNSEQLHVGTAFFIMVLRSTTGSANIAFPKLNLASSVDVSNFQEAESRKLARLKHSKSNLMNTPPTPDEVVVLHDLFAKVKNATSKNITLGFDKRRNVADYNETSTVNFTWLDQTRHSSTLIMHSQNRNAHGKIFGGHLMRIMMELAWSNAYLFSGVFPCLLQVDDIMFHRPVEIGSIVKFRSLASYCDPVSGIVIVAVTVEMHESKNDIRDVVTTDTSFFAFSCMKELPEVLSTVMPHSYEESMLYLQSRRIFLKYKSEVELSSKGDSI